MAGCLCLIALDHDPRERVDLCRMVSRPLGYHAALVQVPEDDRAILRARCEIAVALGNLDVDNHVRMAVQGRLQAKGILGPDLYNPVTRCQQCLLTRHLRR